jgi:hypothetical protein
MTVLVPGWVARNLRVEQMLSSASDSNIAYWNRRLQEIDPALALAFAGENACGPGLVPGRWHVRRRNPMGPDTYWPIQTPDGEFREMDSGVLAEFVAADLWNTQVLRDREKSVMRAARSAERDKDNHKEGRVGELALAIKAQTNPSTLISRDVRWSSRPAGKRGRKQG